MKLLIGLGVILSSHVLAQTPDVNINRLLNQYLSSTGSDNVGVVGGVADIKTNHIRTFSKGAITNADDLRLVCPASKPALSYLILKKGISLNATIDKWFPLNQGYAKSDKITIQMLLSNTSGIKDYVTLLFRHKDAESVQYTVDSAYKNQDLAFNPGDSILYSNTGFNAAGIILEKETQKTVDELLRESFKEVAPSIRMDDGHGRYPRGYNIREWPYHYSLSGFSGGLIGTIEDYLRMMVFISRQPEFAVMTDWIQDADGYKTDSYGYRYGLGVLGIEDMIKYLGNSGVNLSLLIMKGEKVFYFHTTNELNNDPMVLRGYNVLQALAEARLAEVGRLVDDFFGGTDGLDPVAREELLKRARGRDVVVLDVRPAEEYAAGHIAGAVSLPMAELERRLAEVPRGQRVVAYCRGSYCVLAAEAVRLLRKRGVDAVRLKEGFPEWRDAGLPVEEGSSPKTRRAKEQRR